MTAVRHSELTHSSHDNIRDAEAERVRDYRPVLEMGRPQLQLVTQRIVSDSAQSIAFALKGNIDGLKDLFARGLASPRDVSSSRGFGLMRWALYGGMHQYRTVQFLINQGAHVDDESYDNVFDFTFRNKCSDTELQELRCVRQSQARDWIEEQNFPLIHQIIFSLSRKPLAAELEENPTSIDVKDTQGRTALDWATARAQLDDMRTLIAHGSNLNTMDITGRTTILHAVDSHHAGAVRILLEAGADPNPTVPKGLFRSSPLTSASTGGLAEMTALLLCYGARTDERNPEGLTALHAAARTQNAECAALLLQAGASLEEESRAGRTPFTIAIVHNSHAVLRLFVDVVNQRYQNATTTAGIPNGAHMLSVTVEHADAETMSILASSLPLKLSLCLDEDAFTVGREILQRRHDYDEELHLAFDGLLNEATASWTAGCGL